MGRLTEHHPKTWHALTQTQIFFDDGDQHGAIASRYLLSGGYKTLGDETLKVHKPYMTFRLFMAQKSSTSGVFAPPGSGGGWNAPMPVPDKMTVRWTVNGQPQEVTFPLKDKLSGNSLENWRLRFFGERLEVWREELIAPPSTPTGLRPRKLVQVFP